jgi:hypothetical protein
MGFSLGAFAGGAVSGYQSTKKMEMEQQDADSRKQDADFRKEEHDRLKSERSKDDDINKDVADHAQKILLVPTDNVPIIQNQAANGIGSIPASPVIQDNAPAWATQGNTPTDPQATTPQSIAQQAVPVTDTSLATNQSTQNQAAPDSPVVSSAPAWTGQADMQALADSTNPQQSSPQAAQGLNAPASTLSAPADPSKPQYRQPDVNDMADIAQYRSAAYAKAGMFDKAMAAHKDYLAFANEKLVNEQGQRTAAAQQAIPGIMSGDYSSLGNFYKMLPDGKTLGKVVDNKDGSITVHTVAKDGTEVFPPATFKDKQQLANTVISLADPKVALSYMAKQSELAIEQAKNQTTADHYKAQESQQAADAAETRRSHIANEGIGLKNANNSAKAANASTAEIKNMDYMVANGIAKDKAEAWSMINSGRTSSNTQNIPDGMGGFTQVNNATGRITRMDRSGKETVMREGSNSGRSNNATPTAVIKSLPSGAKQIGTSGGKPVYQTPDGKKFIGE